MTMSSPALSTKSLILVPAAITFAVTLLRLVGEVERWDPRFFNSAAGGGGALVGIVWLVPVFGVWFALRLARAGGGPSSRVAAILWPSGAIVLFLAAAMALRKLEVGFLVLGPAVNFVAVAAGFLAYRAWPALGRVSFAYGLAARIPVALVMLVAIHAHWGTHYDVSPPGLPAMSPLATWLVIGFVPQMFFWVAFTVVVAGLFGGFAALAVRSR